MKSWLLREPLLHFLLGGGLLYAIHASGPSRPDQIVVDKSSLAQWLRVKTKLSEPEILERYLSSLERREVMKLARMYVDEEILLREAANYGLDKNDPVVRQRLIQASRQILDLTGPAGVPTEADLRSYYLRNRHWYIVPASITFTHIFFDQNRAGDSAFSIAKKTIAKLNADKTPFEAAPAFGDRFPYLVNYVDRNKDLIESHFGLTLTRKLLTLSPSNYQWQGPYKSPLGWHLVLLVAKTDERQLTFDQAREEVIRNFLEDRQLDVRRQSLARLREKYRHSVRYHFD